MKLFEPDKRCKTKKSCEMIRHFHGSFLCFFRRLMYNENKFSWKEDIMITTWLIFEMAGTIAFAFPALLSGSTKEWIFSASRCSPS